MIGHLSSEEVSGVEIPVVQPAAGSGRLISEEIATLLGVQRKTITYYASRRGQAEKFGDVAYVNNPFPEPAGKEGFRHPWYRLEDVAEYAANRARGAHCTIVELPDGTCIALPAGSRIHAAPDELFNS